MAEEVISEVMIRQTNENKIEFSFKGDSYAVGNMIAKLLKAIKDNEKYGLYCVSFTSAAHYLEELMKAEKEAEDRSKRTSKE